jgi:hypothetical protein
MHFSVADYDSDRRKVPSGKFAPECAQSVTNFAVKITFRSPFAQMLPSLAPKSRAARATPEILLGERDFLPRDQL